MKIPPNRWPQEVSVGEGQVVIDILVKIPLSAVVGRRNRCNKMSLHFLGHFNTPLVASHSTRSDGTFELASSHNL